MFYIIHVDKDTGSRREDGGAAFISGAGTDGALPVPGTLQRDATAAGRHFLHHAGLTVEHCGTMQQATLQSGLGMQGGAHIIMPVSQRLSKPTCSRLGASCMLASMTATSSIIEGQ